jgi:hypothetical protein
MKTSFLMVCTSVIGAGLVWLAPSAQADDDAYLSTLREEYWTHSFTDSQLLAEGYKVCDLTANYDDETLYNMVQSDLGVSGTAAASLVGAAVGGLGC